MMPMTRRRCITISAAAAGLPLLPVRRAGAEPRLLVWRGAALGADAILQIHHPDAAVAKRLIEASLAEVARLERVLSLYRADSALCRLNRDGVLDEPPFDLVRVLSDSRRYGALTGGAFDVTVQPLWALFAAHFAAAGAGAVSDGPLAAVVSDGPPAAGLSDGPPAAMPMAAPDGRPAAMLSDGPPAAMLLDRPPAAMLLDEPSAAMPLDRPPAAMPLDRPPAAMPMDGPPAAVVAAVLERVGQDGLEVEPGRVRLRRKGMAVTLNGIGQGYVTDRVVEILRAGGVERALVDMGETRAIGGHPRGGPWSVGLEDPRAPGTVAERIGLSDRAVATSGGYGTVFDPARRFNHLFEPGSGRCSWRWLSVSVELATATEADALSTAFSLMPEEATARIVRSLGLVAHFVRPDGSRLVQRG